MGVGKLPSPKGSAWHSFYEAQAASDLIASERPQLQGSCCTLGGVTTISNDDHGIMRNERKVMHNSNPNIRVSPYAVKAKERMPQCISVPAGSCPSKGWTIDKYCEACHS